jgi:5'-3' exonuclease
MLIIDGDHCLHRILHTVSYTEMRTQTGQAFGGVFGFFKSMHKMLEKFRPTRCIVVWDGGTSQRRKAMYEEYKGNRRKDDPKSLEYLRHFREQKLLLKDLIPFSGAFSLSLDREGDDVIWKVRSLWPGPAVISSEDNDFAQMVNRSTTLYYPIKDKSVTLENFEDLFGLQKDSFLVYKSILGDVSDAVKGIKGVGETTARRIAKNVPATDWVSVQEYCAKQPDTRIQAVSRNMDVVKRNYELVCLGLEKFTPQEVETIQQILTATPQQDFTALRVAFSQMEFQSLLSSFHEWSIPFQRLIIPFQRLIRRDIS